MPPNMMKALVGSRLKVTGNRTATVNAGPIPGSTPIAVPSVVPTQRPSEMMKGERAHEAVAQRAESLHHLAAPVPMLTCVA